MNLTEWNARLHGLVIFRALLDDDVIAKFVDLTDRMAAAPQSTGAVCDAAASFEAALFEHTTNFGEYLSAAVLEAETVCVRQGVALNAVVNVRPRIKLQPFRTFLEVAQPESEFLLRVDSEKGIAFFEADGGIWRLEAKRNIAEYFERGLKDLVEQGKVVIMQ